MSIIFSVFSNTRATRPDRVETDWSGFVEFLRGCASVERPATAVHKFNQTPAISPAYYSPGDTRSNARALGWGGWVALDIDSGLPPAAALARVEQYNHVIYNSTSSTVGHPKYRIAIEADRHIASTEAPALWVALSDLLPDLDRQCRDLSRLYFVPADWLASAENPAPLAIWSERTDGNTLAVDALITSVADKMPSQPVIGPSVNAVAGGAARDGSLMRPEVLSEYLSLPRGEHHGGLYRLMCRVAADAIGSGVAINSTDLIEMAREADSLCAVKTNAARWGRIREEAQRALSWAASNCKVRPSARLGMFGR